MLNNGRKCLTNSHPDTTYVISLGVVLNYNFGMQPPKATRSHMALADLLTQYAMRLHPKLTFSRSQVCRHAPPKLCVDPRNVGLRGLVTCGDYVGDKLWTWGDVRGSATMEVADPIRNRPGISVGNVINGNLHVTRENMVICGATNPHCDEPFVGARYSFTYYTLARC